ncbi:MAG: XisI protein [Moorea sp. SIO3C2]|nr:XisI protein [Moorena sp. SIO3C2]
MAVEQYRQYIRNLLSERAQRASRQTIAPEYVGALSNGRVNRPWVAPEVQTVFDTEQDHYQLLYVGWRGNKRDFGCILHLDIKGGKIWIQHDGTEEGLANRLVEMGVPKEDIVLAFHEPEVRQFTGFGIG